MNIKISIKQLGKKRAKISEADFSLEHTPETVRDLIRETVHTCVFAYNARVRNGKNDTKPLSESEITDMSEIGKIAFGINYGGKEQNEQAAAENALIAYEDGIVRIFIGETEAGALDDAILLKENDTVTFIRLAMLSGLMW